MSNRKQININLSKTEDADMLALVEQRAGVWGIPVSAAAKRLLAMAVSPVSSVEQPPPWASTETAELIRALATMTCELVALRKQVSGLQAIHPVPAAPRRPADEPDRTYTEADLTLEAPFLAAVRKVARPGMRLEQ